MDPKQTVQAFVHAINFQESTRLDSLVATESVRHSIAAGNLPVRSRSDLVTSGRREFENFRDTLETILDMFAERQEGCRETPFQRNSTRRDGLVPSDWQDHEGGIHRNLSCPVTLRLLARNNFRL
jgi:hypothetical protein